MTMSTTVTMTVTVNGQPVELPAQATVADLLAQLGKSAVPCAVEVNKAVVRKRDHAAAALKPADTIEIVTLVGGG